MHRPNWNPEAVGELLQAELADAAFAVTSRYEVEGPAADRRWALWHALGRLVHRQREADGTGTRREALVAEATDAAYRVALDRGFRGSFLDLELDLWRSLCRALDGGCDHNLS
jgi:hypothetical protein